MTERETAISQTARGLSFDDFVITEDGDELLAQCEEEVFFLRIKPSSKRPCRYQHRKTS